MNTLPFPSPLARASELQRVEFDRELIRRYDGKGPRYTSYPTADRFIEAYTAETYANWVGKRQLGAVSHTLSLYVHLPFCNTVCYYCACNKVITANRNHADKYLDYLEREIAMQRALIEGPAKVDQLHFGGGTPTFLSDAQLERLMTTIRHHFDLQPNGEFSIEIDPRKVAPATIALLARLGFNRMSVGVQDVNPQVQQAVNRVQSIDDTIGAIKGARSHGFKSVSIDLIYGLPLQTPASMHETIRTVIDMDPDRIALYSYAHLPKLFKPQRQIDEQQLPSAASKLDILQQSVEQLLAAGYLYIGMDHFAKPGDELAVALRQGRLHRNFQGYSTHADCDMLGLGVSAIGKVGPTYSQNQRSLDDYYDMIDRGELPIMRGMVLSADDLVRRAVIQALMCQFELSFEPIETAYLIEFDSYFASELQRLQALAEDGLIQFEPGRLVVTPKGRFLVRVIAMVFDKYLQAEEASHRYSKVI
ncbi:oxygen-independent coproporphyrinogen III oxidase [Parachitinimonas caeni]|uniref:Coproporphyrinogen-III oxidase n=1 Tax=Parachitinimonas caeni TaxID=3031301 RepID=A0ABT7DTE1_9NEIS|nr:oxygen-independent coproporphyrinogen III oxidase [Parachitinimonas caeni]MDK2123347.1 oxygen-independent coproporphyrinogen III oxidase [Parachitinimonas caeni]